jgi:hypothetical protein
VKGIHTKYKNGYQLEVIMMRIIIIIIIIIIIRSSHNLEVRTYSAFTKDTTNIIIMPNMGERKHQFKRSKQTKIRMEILKEHNN